MWLRLKRVFKLLAIAFAILLPVVAVVGWFCREGIVAGVREMIRDYESAELEKAMKSQVADLPPVDEAQVFLLADEPASTGEKAFMNAIWEGPKYLLKQVTLNSVEAKNLAALWRKQTVTKNGVMCHSPHHAIRFYCRGSLVSETMICFHCINASIPCGWSRDLVMFGLGDANYLELKSELERLVGSAP